VKGIGIGNGLIAGLPAGAGKRLADIAAPPVTMIALDIRL